MFAPRRRSAMNLIAADDQVEHATDQSKLGPRRSAQRADWKKDATVGLDVLCRSQEGLKAQKVDSYRGAAFGLQPSVVPAVAHHFCGV